MFQVLVLLSSFLAVFAARHYGVIPHKYEGGLGYAVDETPKPYQFAYQAEAIGGASVRQETADGSGAVVGSYSLSDEDGRKRVVDYVADGTGFRASVKTNEPGTKSESSADTLTVSEAGDASVAHVAPATYSGAHHSPYVHGAYGSLGYRGYPYGAHSGAYGHGHHYGGGLGYGYGSSLGYGRGYYGGALGYGRGYYGGALGYGRGYYGGSLGYGRGYYGGSLGYGRGYYGGSLGYGRGYYGGALGYGRGYYGGGLGYGGALGYGSRYYGGALGAYGLGYGFGGYRGHGYGSYYPHGYGYGRGYSYGKHH